MVDSRLTGLAAGEAGGDEADQDPAAVSLLDLRREKNYKTREKNFKKWLCGAY